MILLKDENDLEETAMMNDIQTIEKHKIFFDYEKEEAWINEMAQEGLNLIDFSIGKYTFVEGKPGEYLYRYDYMIGETETEVNQHVEILKQSGIEIVKRYSNWIIPRKKAADGAFKTFADIEMQIRRYQSAIRILNVIALVSLVLGLSSVTSPSPASRVIATISFSVATLLYIGIGSYSSRVKKLTKELKK